MGKNINSPDADYCGTDVFTYQVTDTFGPALSNIATGTITINCTNDDPVAFDDLTQTGTEDTPFLIAVLSNDTDTDNSGSTLSITGLTQPATGATLSISGQSVLVTPLANYCGLTPVSFTYQVADGSGGLSNIATASFAFTCVNDTPIAVNDTDATGRNTPVLVDVKSNDIDPDHTYGQLTIT